MEITRLFDLMYHFEEAFPKKDALAGKENGVWNKYSTQQYIEIATSLSYGLMQLGIKKGDRIATITYNRPEWNFLDMAIMQIGAVHVPIYPTISESDYQYILHHAEVKMVFTAGWELLRKIEHLLPSIPSLNEKEMVYTFKDLRGHKHLNEIIEMGRANPSPVYLKQIQDSVMPDDMATMIYTSGTTGTPKGVMLSHRNILSVVFGVAPIPPIGPQSRALSFLPLCHIYERALIYVWQYLGVSTYYAESLATISENIKEVKPDIISTVPRLLEKIYDKIILNGKKLGFPKRPLFFWANSLAVRYNIDSPNGWWYMLQLQIARKLVLSKWKAALGGNLKVIVSGGASVQSRLVRVFWACEMPVLEGYGLTETSPVIAVSSFFKNGAKIGTVGQILPGIQVKIAADGEILCKGPNVMLGYYKDPELSAQSIDSEGWFHTGDLGQFESEGQLKITGRKKELFKTAFGKYIVPTIIENKFLESPLIDAIMVVGENEKFAAALIVPDFIHLRSWCERKNINYSTNEEMANNADVIKKYKKEVALYNKFFGDTEQIRNFELIGYEWTVQTGELTPTLKLRRKYIMAHFEKQIEALFGSNNEE